MNKIEANNEAKKVYEKWRKDREKIEKDAKENGKWNDIGLDSNNHLFKDVDNEAKEKLAELKKMIDD